MLTICPGKELSLKILIIDDAELIRNRLIRFLSRFGAIEQVLEAKDVAEGISKYEKYHPEIVLLDIRMPGGSGFDILKYIKSTDSESRVLIITNYSSEQYRKESMEVGSDYFFDKARDIKEIENTLHTLISGGITS